jgi:hypothetical protein
MVTKRVPRPDDPFAIRTQSQRTDLSALRLTRQESVVADAFVVVADREQWSPAYAVVRHLQKLAVCKILEDCDGNHISVTGN